MAFMLAFAFVLHESDAGFPATGVPHRFIGGKFSLIANVDSRSRRPKFSPAAPQIVKTGKQGQP